jgi:hypothetical protein
VPTRRYLLLLAFLVLPGALPATAADRHAAPGDDFAVGVAAARDGDLERALAYFEAARQRDGETPTLLYNLAVVNYRLGRLAAAQTEFQRLMDDPDWAALAGYNLGLVATRQGDEAGARQYFRDARARTSDPRLMALADARLTEAPEPVPGPPARGWRGLVSLAGGYDDNVLLADDRLLADAGDDDDLFAELLAAGRRPLASTAETGLTVDVGAYYRAYADLSDFDFGALSASPTWHHRSGSWRVAAGPRIELQLADGTRYATVVGAHVQLDRAGAVAWRLRLDSAYFDGGSRFAFISGWRHRAQARGSQAYDWGVLRIGYEVEHNDRDDLMLDDQFFSYSPIRHGPFATATANLTPRLQVDFSASARWSDYRDDNRFVDETGMLVQAPRDQDSLSASARLGYRLTRRWQVWAQLQYLSSDSRIVRYDYAGQRYLIGLENSF